jgi:hypothetical protein
MTTNPDALVSSVQGKAKCEVEMLLQELEGRAGGRAASGKTYFCKLEYRATRNLSLSPLNLSPIINLQSHIEQKLPNKCATFLK